jgi:hypothetical protein
MSSTPAARAVESLASKDQLADAIARFTAARALRKS